MEEAEDAARSPGAASRDVTVEEVHEDDSEHLDDNPQRDAIEDLLDDHDDLEAEGCEARTAPAPKASGLLSRIFSRSKTSQDITKADSEQPDQPARRAERGEPRQRAVSLAPLRHTARARERQSGE